MSAVCFEHGFCQHLISGSLPDLLVDSGSQMEYGVSAKVDEYVSSQHEVAIFPPCSKVTSLQQQLHVVA